MVGQPGMMDGGGGMMMDGGGGGMFNDMGGASGGPMDDMGFNNDSSKSNNYMYLVRSCLFLVTRRGQGLVRTYPAASIFSKCTAFTCQFQGGPSNYVLLVLRTRST